MSFDCGNLLNKIKCDLGISHDGKKAEKEKQTLTLKREKDMATRASGSNNRSIINRGK